MMSNGQALQPEGFFWMQADHALLGQTSTVAISTETSTAGKQTRSSISEMMIDQALAAHISVSHAPMVEAELARPNPAALGAPHELTTTQSTTFLQAASAESASTLPETTVTRTTLPRQLAPSREEVKQRIRDHVHKLRSKGRLPKCRDQFRDDSDPRSGGCKTCCNDGVRWKPCFDVETCAQSAPLGGKYAFVLVQVGRPGWPWLTFLDTMKAQANMLASTSKSTVDIVLLIPEWDVKRLSQNHLSRIAQFNIKIVKVPWTLPPLLRWWPDDWNPTKTAGWCGPQDLVRLHTVGLDEYDAAAFFDQDIEFHGDVTPVLRCAATGYFLSTAGGVGEPLNVGFFAVRPDKRLLQAAEFFAENVTFNRQNGWDKGGFAPAGGYFVGAECGQGYLHTLYYKDTKKARMALKAANIKLGSNGAVKMEQIDKCIWNYQTGSDCPYKYDCNLVRAHHKPTQKDHGRDCPKLAYRTTTTTSSPPPLKPILPCDIVSIHVGDHCKCNGVYSKKIAADGIIQECQLSTCNPPGDMFSVTFTESEVKITREDADGCWCDGDIKVHCCIAPKADH
eukprot:TRINITY_DN26485_c0_g1_i1.p1 TRINITY_DN26485_c0_g1~~TRINITY_DN26485_c0_g1_i1.p1  ORF type:complete len:564 (-),score=93.18 TRINITY_DN26485_c0_g1_i1:64-1755(-)